MDPAESGLFVNTREEPNAVGASCADRRDRARSQTSEFICNSQQSKCQHSVRRARDHHEPIRDARADGKYDARPVSTPLSWAGASINLTNCRWRARHTWERPLATPRCSHPWSYVGQRDARTCESARVDQRGAGRSCLRPFV